MTDDIPKRTGTEQNGPELTDENTQTDFYGYRNGPERTSVLTETGRNSLQLIPKRTSMGTRKGRMGLFVLGFYGPVNNEVMSSRSVNSGTVPGQA